MKIITPNLKVKVLNSSTYIPEEFIYSNREILDLNPETNKLPGFVKDKLAKSIYKKFGFKNRAVINFPNNKTNNNFYSEDILEVLLKEISSVSFKKNIDLLIHGSTTQSRYTGTQSTKVLRGINQFSPTIEMKAGCSTSLASLYNAILCLGDNSRGGIENVVIACAETLSKIMDPANREHWFGFADGGAAIWLEKTLVNPDFSIKGMVFGTDGEYLDQFTTPGKLPPTIDAIKNNAYSLKGKGEELEILARKYYTEMYNEFNESFDLARVKYIIPHQVNMSLIYDLTKKVFNLKNLETVLNNSSEVGNIGGSSVLYTLCHEIQKNTFESGDQILMMSVGGGLTYSMHLWEKI